MKINIMPNHVFSSKVTNRSNYSESIFKSKSSISSSYEMRPQLSLIRMTSALHTTRHQFIQTFTEIQVLYVSLLLLIIIVSDVYILNIFHRLKSIDK